MTANIANTMIVGSADADLHVRTAGGNPDGETLVVLHGGPGLSHDYMSGLVELASPDLRIVFYDQRGVARSTGQVDHDLLGSQARDLAAVQDALGVQRYTCSAIRSADWSWRCSPASTRTRPRPRSSSKAHHSPGQNSTPHSRT